MSMAFLIRSITGTKLTSEAIKSFQASFENDIAYITSNKIFINADRRDLERQIYLLTSLGVACETAPQDNLMVEVCITGDTIHTLEGEEYEITNNTWSHVTKH